MLQVNTVLQTNNGTPQYATPGAAGCDLKAELTLINDKFLFNALKDIDNTCLVIRPNGRALIPTGLHISLPKGYEAHVRPRSGLALKYGITVLNTPGTIDASPKTQIKINYIINF